MLLLVSSFGPALQGAIGPGWTNPTGKYGSMVVYLQVLDASGTPVQDSNSRVGAFIGTNPMGVASIMPGPNASQLYQLVLRADTSGSVVSYQLYHGVYQQALALSSNTVFQDSNTLGTIAHPVQLSIVGPPVTNPTSPTSFAQSFGGVSATSDWQGQGVPALYKYAAGGTTNRADRFKLPQVSVVGGKLQCTYLARTNDPNLSFSVEGNSSHTNTNGWSAVGVSTSVVGTTNVNGTPLQVRCATVTSSSNAPQFLRLKVGNAIGGSSQAQVSGDVLGSTPVDLPAGGRLVAPVYVKPSAYSGSSTVSGNNFSASGLTPNEFHPTLHTDAPNYPTHYVEVTSGAYQGYCYDISSNDSNGITVYGMPPALQGQTVNLCVRPHVTLGDIAVGASGLSDYADSVTIYRAGNQHESYIYAGRGFLCQDYATPANDVIIYPGTGVILNNNSAARITFSGAVKQTRTVVPIFPGENLVAPLDPVGGGGLNDQSLAPALTPYSDSVSVPSTDGKLQNASYYSDGSQLLDNGYTPLRSSNAPILPVGSSLIINSQRNSYWAR